MKATGIILFTFLSVNLFGQVPNDSTGLKIFNRGLEHYKKENLDSALILWTTIVENKIGIRYDTYGNAFFNIPALYWQMKNHEKAKEWYKKILASGLKDNEETGSLMEPYANYKHNSAIALAGLYQQDSNYAQVIHWLYQADTLYRYWGFEGSATNVSKEQAYLLEWKTEVLRKLNRSDEAIRNILTELICSNRLESFFVASQDTLLKLTANGSFKTKFTNALNQLSLTKLNENNWIATFSLNNLTYKIPVSNVYPDKKIPHYWTTYFIDKNTVPDKQNLIDYIKKRSFYLGLTD